MAVNDVDAAAFAWPNFQRRQDATSHDVLEQRFVVFILAIGAARRIKARLFVNIADTDFLGISTLERAFGGHLAERFHKHFLKKPVSKAGGNKARTEAQTIVRVTSESAFE
jgi:hypothetical protein